MKTTTRMCRLLAASALVTTGCDGVTEPQVDSQTAATLSSYPVQQVSGGATAVAGTHVVGFRYLDDASRLLVGSALRAHFPSERAILGVSVFLDLGSTAADANREIDLQGAALAQQLKRTLGAAFGADEASLSGAPSQLVIILYGNIHAKADAAGKRTARAVGALAAQKLLPELSSLPYAKRLHLWVSPSLEDEAGAAWTTLANETVNGLGKLPDAWYGRVRLVRNPVPKRQKATKSRPEHITSDFSKHVSTMKAAFIVTQGTGTPARVVSRSIPVLAQCHARWQDCSSAPGKTVLLSNDGYSVLAAGEAVVNEANSGTYSGIAPSSTTRYETSIKPPAGKTVLWLAWHPLGNLFEIRTHGGKPMYSRPASPIWNRRPSPETPNYLGRWLNEVLKH